MLSDSKNAYLKYKVIQKKGNCMPLGSTGVIFGRIWNLNRFLKDKEDFEFKKKKRRDDKVGLFQVDESHK